MTERKRPRKKEGEKEGATGRPKRDPSLNGRTQLTVMGSRQPLSVRVGVMPVNGDAVIDIETLDFKSWIVSRKTGITSTQKELTSTRSVRLRTKSDVRTRKNGGYGGT